MPHTLVLLPDQACFYVVYRLPSISQFQPADEREFRLRTEPKWFSGPRNARDHSQQEKLR